MSDGLPRGLELRALLGTWGAPPDAVAWGALALAVPLCLLAGTRAGRLWLQRAVFDATKASFLWGVCGLAALGSLGYVAHYLRGGPRIVDGTTYLLEARALAGGHFTFPAGFPSASTRGRFLLYDETTGALGGLFPPGYPLLLSLGVRLGAPMVVGPAIAAALVAATRALGVRVASELGAPEPERIGRIAALFSLGSATLRYHTADTMSHGACALYVACGLVALFEWRRAGRRTYALAVGLAVGALVATRPVSALPLALVAATAFARGAGASETTAGRGRAWPSRLACAGLAAVGMLPGVALLLGWQEALTGHALGSPQLLYYARSDGPAGCFRYGFGDGIGCLYEHGDFVRHNLARGYGALAALGTTARRLKMHLADAANLELFFPLLFVPLVAARRAPAARALGGVLALQVLAYAPFYFDGNFPGGGARFFADVLPIEHVLLALALSRSARGRASSHGLSAAPWLGFAAALVGFAVHTSFDHRALATREGGVPFFDGDVLARANVTTGLVFVETDHGFSLGHSPGAEPARAPLVVRRRDDDHDWLAFVTRDRPETWIYRIEAGEAHVVPWAPPAPSGPLRFEAEADWPPLHQEGGYAVPTWMSGVASGDRVLTLTPVPGSGHASASIALPSTRAASFDVVPRVLAARGVSGAVRVGQTEWSFEGEDRLIELPRKRVELARGETRLVLEAAGGPVSLDRTLLFPPH